jgi:hypothetical protein
VRLRLRSSKSGAGGPGLSRATRNWILFAGAVIRPIGDRNCGRRGYALDRLLGEHGLEKDTAASRREFERWMKQARLEPGDQELMRKGWKIGAEDFRDWLADKLARRGRKGERASERRERTHL